MIFWPPIGAQHTGRNRVGAPLPDCVVIGGWIFMEIPRLAEVLVALGCPAEKSADMAAQLDRRARQLAAEKGGSHDAALTHLLTLMKQGWAAPRK